MLSQEGIFAFIFLKFFDVYKQIRQIFSGPPEVKETGAEGKMMTS